jgi:transcriptional regulator with XRE-family HTH domain
MAGKYVEGLCRSLNVRRQMLKMSYAIVAKRSGVSTPTVIRILSGSNPNASFASVVRIAEAVGMGVKFEPETGVADLRERQAENKARRLSRMVQGTSGLEAQAIDADDLEGMTRQTAHELLAGSARKLWNE